MYHIFLSACCFRFAIHFCRRQFLFNVHGTCVVNLFMPIWCFMIIYSTYFPLASHRWCVFLFYVSSSFLCRSVCLVISYIVYIFPFDAVRLKAYWIFLTFSSSLPTLTKRQLAKEATPLHHDNWKSHVELFSKRKMKIFRSAPREFYEYLTRLSDVCESELKNDILHSDSRGMIKHKINEGGDWGLNEWWNLG